jgi:hypothetical protein
MLNNPTTIASRVVLTATHTVDWCYVTAKYSKIIKSGIWNLKSFELSKLKNDHSLPSQGFVTLPFSLYTSIDSGGRQPGLFVDGHLQGCSGEQSQHTKPGWLLYLLGVKVASYRAKLTIPKRKYILEDSRFTFHSCLNTQVLYIPDPYRPTRPVSTCGLVAYRLHSRRRYDARQQLDSR